MKKEASTSVEIGMKMQDEEQTAATGFKGQRWKDWIDEVYWSSMWFRKPSAYHI